MLLPWLIPLVVLVAVPLVWVGVVALVSRAGWARLAAHYETDAPATGRTFRFVSGAVGLATYGNALTVSLEPDGLRLAVIAPFRPGHPPLLIPWDEVGDVRRRKVLWHTDYALTPTAEGAATIRLPQRVVEAIREAGR